MLLLTAALAAEVDTHVEARVIGSLYPSHALDDEGTTSGQNGVVDTRVRLGADLAFNDRDALHIEGDLFDAQVLGNPWVLGDEDARRRDQKGVLRGSAYVPRRLSATTALGPVSIEAGLQTSHWGLGLLANDGAHDPLFGRTDGGDTVLRLKLATMPLGPEKPLFVVATADRVYADEIGSWLAGQAAYQGSLAVLWRGDMELGAYAVYRNQKEAERRLVTSVGVLDVYGRVPLVQGDTNVALGWEAVGIMGNTSRAASYNATDGLAVSSAGALGQLAVERGPIWGVLRGGYATGDGNPYDEGTHDFSADPNMNVGFVLYDEVLGTIDARAYQQLDDPGNIGQPPGGAETIAAEGAWRRSVFAQPVIAWTGPVEVKLGAVLAWGTTPYAQPFTSGRAGGNPTTHLNDPWSGSYHLGTELDWSVSWTKDTDKAGFDVLAQGGYALPGAALGMEENLVMLHTLQLRARM